jgi:hypothetical protein
MVDIKKILKDLAVRRPVFHSEADFKFALAWAIQEADSKAKVRLEYPAFSEDSEDRWVDLWVRTAERPLAIELKYITRAVRLATRLDDESDEVFNLKNHAAPDQRRFDYVYDICRLEVLAKANINLVGYAILVTNVAAFWSPGHSECQGDAFKIHENRCLSGTLAWADETSVGTKSGRADVLKLTGEYTMHWKDYSSVADVAGSKFRYLLTEVPRYEGVTGLPQTGAELEPEE